MNANHNTLSNDLILNSEIKNKGFAILDGIFKQNGWHLIKNQQNWICYTKFGDETTMFDIKILPDKICTSIPIKNSPYQYNTNFNSYFNASEYIEQRLYDYINTKTL